MQKMEKFEVALTAGHSFQLSGRPELKPMKLFGLKVINEFFINDNK